MIKKYKQIDLVLTYFEENSEITKKLNDFGKKYLTKLEFPKEKEDTDKEDKERLEYDVESFGESLLEDLKVQFKIKVTDSFWHTFKTNFKKKE